MAWYAYTKGDIDRLVLPTDSHNRKCGADSSVLKKPYLVFLDLTKCVDISVPIHGCPTTQICVDKCPQEDFLFDLIEPSMDINLFRNKLICDVDTASITSYAEAKSYVEKDVCARWYLKSQSGE